MVEAKDKAKFGIHREKGAYAHAYGLRLDGGAGLVRIC